MTDKRSTALTGALAVLVSFAAVCCFASSAFAGKSEWSMFEDGRHLITTDPATRQATLDEIKALGADTLRIGVGWDEVAPTPTAKKPPPDFDDKNPGAYPGFGVFDDLMVRAQTMGFRVMITLAPDAPRWATSGGRGGNYKISPDRFANFASVVGKRYSGTYNGLPKVAYWSFWNEPNHSFFIKPRAQAARVYRRMVERGVPALRAAVPGAQVFVGELAPVGTDTKVIGPLSFLRKWLCLDDAYKPLRGAKASASGCKGFKKVKANGFAHHPYGSQAPNTKPPPGRDIVNISVIRRLSKALDKAARTGRITGRLPIYNTEFGFQSSPPDPFVGINLTTQARLINEGEELSYRNSRLRSYSQYLLYDDNPRSGSAAVKWAGFQTGLRFSNGKAKPSYDAYKFPIVVRRKKSGVKIWGRVRPGTGPRFVQIQRSKGGPFTDDGGIVQTDSAGYINLSRPKAASFRLIAYTTDPLTGQRILAGQSRTATPIQ